MISDFVIDLFRQGIKWIKSKYGDSLVVIRLTQRNYLDRIERAINNGDVVLLENIGETVDAVLEPLLGRVLIRKGRVLKVLIIVTLCTKYHPIHSNNI